MRQWLRSYWVTYVRMSRRERRNLIEVLNSADAQSFVEANRPLDGAMSVEYGARTQPTTIAVSYEQLIELIDAARQAVLRRQRFDDPVMEQLAAAVLAMERGMR